MFGCAAPQTAPAPQSQPTEALLPLMVEQMVAQALTQTAQAVTPTLPPTATPVATFTVTPEPTVSVTAASAAAEDSLAVQEDGSALYADPQTKFSIRIPAGWLTVRPSGVEFLDALSFYGQNDPLVYAALTAQQNQSGLRLFAVNLQYENFENEPATAIQIEWKDAQEFVLNEASLQALADELSAATAGLSVNSMDMVTNPAQIRLGAIESQTGGVVQKRVYLPAPRGFLLATLTAAERIKLEILPAFDAIMDTLAPIP
ncbi:MAG: hypothetical protein Fur002_14520 [Anaerolineales bacterium]